MSLQTANLRFNPVIFPKKEIVAFCSCCGEELARRGWESYGDYNRQVKRIEREIEHCKKCKATFKTTASVADIAWSKTTDGDYIARAKNGDFLVWKYGHYWKWRYRQYNAELPERIYSASSKENAKKACEKHHEWGV